MPANLCHMLKNVPPIVAGTIAYSIEPSVSLLPGGDSRV